MGGFKIKVSVILPVYNASRTIKECLNSVLNQDYTNYELIIVDDVSTDNSVSIIKSFKDKRISFIKNNKNGGPGFTRNVAIKNSNGEIILLVDSDTIVPKNWISKHVEEQTNADIVGGSILGVHRTISGEADAFCSHFTSIPNSKRRYLTKFLLPTNNLSIKRLVFDKIGYYREDFKNSEDAEFCNRAIKNNIKILFTPEIIVKHLDREGFKNFLRHQYSWGIDFVKLRKGNKMEYSWLVPPNFILSLFYILPLAGLHTIWLVRQWIKYKPKIILYIPLIFIGKLAQTISISRSFLNK